MLIWGRQWIKMKACLAVNVNGITFMRHYWIKSSNKFTLRNVFCVSKISHDMLDNVCSAVCLKMIYLWIKELSPMIRISPAWHFLDVVGVHRPSWWSLRHPSDWFLRLWPQHPTGSGGRSGSMLPPFMPQQRIHPHFNLISVNTSPSSSPVRF